MNTPSASKIEMALGLYKCCDAASPVSSQLGVNLWGLLQLNVLQLYQSQVQIYGDTSSVPDRHIA